MIVHDKWAILVVSLAFVEGALVLGILTLFAPALEFQGVETSLAGLSVAAYGVATLVFSRFVRPLTTRLTSSRVIGLGGICLTVGLGLVAVHLSVLTVVLAALLFGGAWAFMHTGLQSWVTQIIPAARGMMVAFFAGALAEVGAWAWIFGNGAAIALALTIVSVGARARYIYRS